MGKQCQNFIFGGAPTSLQMVTAAMKLKDTPWKESYMSIYVFYQFFDWVVSLDTIILLKFIHVLL